MRLLEFVRIHAGGDGSGCDPDAAAANGNKCGRPITQGKAGNFSDDDKQKMKDKGMLLPLSEQGKQFPGSLIDNSKIKESKIAYNSLGYAYTHTVLNTADRPKAALMGKQLVNARQWTNKPLDRPHPLKDKFMQSMRPILDNHRRSFVYEARSDSEGSGSVLWIHHERTGPTTARIYMQEVKLENNVILETKEIVFSTSKAAKRFLGYRYGIREIYWTKQ